MGFLSVRIKNSEGKKWPNQLFNETIEVCFHGKRIVICVTAKLFGRSQIKTVRSKPLGFNVFRYFIYLSTQSRS